MTISPKRANSCPEPGPFGPPSSQYTLQEGLRRIGQSEEIFAYDADSFSVGDGGDGSHGGHVADCSSIGDDTDKDEVYFTPREEFSENEEDGHDTVFLPCRLAPDINPACLVHSIQKKLLEGVREITGEDAQERDPYPSPADPAPSSPEQKVQESRSKKS